MAWSLRKTHKLNDNRSVGAECWGEICDRVKNPLCRRTRQVVRRSFWRMTGPLFDALVGIIKDRSAF